MLINENLKMTFLLKESVTKIQKNDNKSVRYLTKLLTANKYDNGLIKAILQTNRILSLSVCQLNLGVKEFHAFGR